MRLPILQFVAENSVIGKYLAAEHDSCTQNVSAAAISLTNRGAYAAAPQPTGLHHQNHPNRIPAEDLRYV